MIMEEKGSTTINLIKRGERESVCVCINEQELKDLKLRRIFT